MKFGRLITAIFMFSGLCIALDSCSREKPKTSEQVHLGTIRGRLEIFQNPDGPFRGAHVSMTRTAEGVSISELLKRGSPTADSLKTMYRTYFGSDSISNQSDWPEPGYSEDFGRYVRFKSDGSFQASGLPEGLYTVEVYPSPNYFGTTDYIEGHLPGIVIDVKIVRGKAAIVLLPPFNFNGPLSWVEKYEPL